MNHTRWIQMVIRLLPFNSGLSLRFRRHLEQCPECQGELADIQEARASTIGQEDIGASRDFWPAFALSLERSRRGEPGKGRLIWAWAVGTAGLLAATIAGLFLWFPSSPGSFLSSGVKLRVNYVRMYEQPAQAFIFQSQDADSTFVWVEKPKPGGVS